jgi:ribose transport system permease protein
MASLLSHFTLRRLAALPPAYYVFGLLLLTLWLARPNMLNPNVLGIFVRQVVPLGILVLGQLLVMRVRSIDLSGGGVILLINYIITSRIFPEASGLMFVLIALTIGGAVGLLNGYMVAKRRVSAVIVTLAVSIILVGLVQYLSSGKPPGDVPKYMNEIFDIKYGAMPLPVLFWLACHWTDTAQAPPE